MNLERLKELIAHATHKPLLDTFDFADVVYHKTVHKGRGLETTCQTCGCLLGEFPGCWPERFRWKIPGGEIGLTSLEDQAAYREWRKALPAEELSARESFLIARWWLSCTKNEVDYLFAPSDADDENPLGDNQLSIYSCRSDVLDNATQFIQDREEDLRQSP